MNCPERAIAKTNEKVKRDEVKFKLEGNMFEFLYPYEFDLSIEEAIEIFERRRPESLANLLKLYTY